MYLHTNMAGWGPPGKHSGNCERAGGFGRWRLFGEAGRVVGVCGGGSVGMWEGLAQLTLRLFVNELMILLNGIKWEQETALRVPVPLCFLVRLTANLQVSNTIAWQQKHGWSCAG